MDEDQIRKIFEEEFSKMDGLYDSSDIIKPFMPELQANGTKVFDVRYRSLRYSNKTKRGFITKHNPTHIEVIVDIPTKQTWITDIAVGETYQNKGFARKMIEAAESISRRCGMELIRLQNVYTDAIPFWEHMGYKTMKYGKLEIMAKKI